MTIRRGWFMVAIAGVLALVGVIIAQTKKTNLVAVNQVITVDATATCVDLQSRPAYTNGSNVNDTVEWKPKAGSGVTQFHIIFIGNSPSASRKNYTSA